MNKHFLGSGFSAKVMVLSLALVGFAGCGDDDDDDVTPLGGRGGAAQGGGTARGGAGGSGGAALGGASARGGNGGGLNLGGSGGDAGGDGVTAGAAGSGLAGGGTGGGSSGAGGDGGAQGGSAGATQGGVGGDGAAGDGNVGGASAVGANLNDAQILLVLQTLNQGEAAQANAALSKLTGDVQDFAQEMVTEHTAAATAVIDLSADLSLTPASSALERKLDSTSDALVATFTNATAANLNELYIETQVAVHGDALELLVELLASAEAAELKALITTQQASVQAHFDEAAELQETLE